MQSVITKRCNVVLRESNLQRELITRTRKGQSTLYGHALKRENWNVLRQWENWD